MTYRSMPRLVRQFDSLDGTSKAQNRQTQRAFVPVLLARTVARMERSAEGGEVQSGAALAVWRSVERGAAKARLSPDCAAPPTAAPLHPGYNAVLAISAPPNAPVA